MIRSKLEIDPNPVMALHDIDEIGANELACTIVAKHAGGRTPASLRAMLSELADVGFTFTTSSIHQVH